MLVLKSGFYEHCISTSSPVLIGKRAFIFLLASIVTPTGKCVQ